MIPREMSRLGCVVALVVAGRAAVAADWNGLENQGAPVAYLAQPSVALLSSSRSVVVGTRLDGGVVRLGGMLVDRGVWTALGGASVDEGTAVAHRAPRLAADGAGHAALLYGRFDGSVWRLAARWFDGAVFSDLSGGAPVDQDVGGNTGGFAGAFVTITKLVVAYTKDDGSRMALFVRSWNGGGWQDENAGAALDDPAGIGADAPAIAGDGAGGALVAYVQYGSGGQRLTTVRLDATGWQPTGAATPPDHLGLGGVSSPAVTALAGGRWLVAYVQEDADGASQHLYAAVWTGSSWAYVNEGLPLDGYPKGVRAPAVASDGAGGAILVYTTADLVDGIEAPTVRSLRVTGLSATPMNGGDFLEAAGAGTIPALALATWGVGGACSALLLMDEQSGGIDRVYSRAILAPVAATPVATAPAETGPGVRVTHNLFRPDRGEQARIVYVSPTSERLRVAIYSLAGTAVRLVSDGPLAGRGEWMWDGRDDAGQTVGAGVYLLVAEAGSARDTRKIVVVR